jgi:hypothetical protein
MGIVLLISGVLGPLLGGLLADLCQRSGGPRRTMTLMIGLALLQIPSGFFGVMPSVFLMSALLVVLSTICYMKGIICTTISTVVIPDELLGLCFGAQNAIGSVFVSLSPVLVSQLSSSTGGPEKIGESLTMVCIATSLLGAVAFAAGRRYFPGAPARSHPATLR